MYTATLHIDICILCTAVHYSLYHVPLNHACPYSPMVKDIVHTIHQFKHEHCLRIAHSWKVHTQPVQ